MGTQRHLRNAPISECLIDFRVPRLGHLREVDRSALRDELAPRYPDVEEQRGFSAQFQMGPDAKPQPPQTEDLGVSGVFFKTDDGKQVVQYRKDGFTFNRLRPYTKWEEIKPEALLLWDHYVRVLNPRSVERVGVRYINHVPAVSDGPDLFSLLETPITIPGGVPPHMSGFLKVVVLHDPASGNSIRITQSLERPQKDKIVLLLDIDAFFVGDVSCDAEELDLKQACFRWVDQQPIDVCAGQNLPLPGSIAG